MDNTQTTKQKPEDDPEEIKGKKDRERKKPDVRAVPIKSLNWPPRPKW